MAQDLEELLPSLWQIYEHNKNLKEQEKQFCPACKTAKALDEFHPSVRGKPGHYCKVCKARINAEWYDIRKYVAPMVHRRKTYGINQRQYQELLRQQKHRCACCAADLKELPPKQVHIDYDPETRKFRGIICQPCNLIAGRGTRDGVKVLRRVIRYLEKHSAKIASSQEQV